MPKKKLKTYEVTLNYWKTVTINAYNEQDAAQGAMMGYGSDDGLQGCSDDYSVEEMDFDEDIEKYEGEEE